MEIAMTKNDIDGFAGPMVGKTVIIRASDAGVFVGTLIGYTTIGSSLAVVLRYSKRVWSWEGAASISELAMRGPGSDGSMIPIALPEHRVVGVCEIAEVTPEALKRINAVPEWSSH